MSGSDIKLNAKYTLPEFVTQMPTPFGVMPTRATWRNLIRLAAMEWRVGLTTRRATLNAIAPPQPEKITLASLRFYAQPRHTNSWVGTLQGAIYDALAGLEVRSPFQAIFRVTSDLLGTHARTNGSMPWK